MYVSIILQKGRKVMLFTSCVQLLLLGVFLNADSCCGAGKSKLCLILQLNIHLCACVSKQMGKMGGTGGKIGGKGLFHRNGSCTRRFLTFVNIVN